MASDDDWQRVSDEMASIERRQWYKRQALTVRVRGETIEAREEWRCYPLGWHVGLVCSVDPLTLQYWARWRGAVSKGDARGTAASLEAAQLAACESAEGLLLDALEELREYNRRPRGGAR